MFKYIFLITKIYLIDESEKNRINIEPTPLE